MYFVMPVARAVKDDFPLHTSIRQENGMLQKPDIFNV